MAVLYVYENPEARIDVYDRLRDEMEDEPTPEGAILHVACRREGGGLVMVEIWDTEEDHDRFEDDLRERVRKAGGTQRTEMQRLQVYNMIYAEEMANMY
jgi:hypothetical protein